MKNKIIYTVLGIFFIYNTVLSQTAVNIVTSNDRLNVLYRHHENHVSISADGEKQKDITILCSEGLKGKKIKDGNYMLKPDHNKDAVFIDVMVKGRFVGKRWYRVVNTCGISFTYGVLPSCSASVKNILQQDTIFNCLSDPFIKWSVTKYRITFYPTSNLHSNDSVLKDTLIYEEWGSAISSRVKECIKQAKPGDQIKLDRIDFLGTGRMGLFASKESFVLIIVSED